MINEIFRQFLKIDKELKTIEPKQIKFNFLHYLSAKYTIPSELNKYDLENSIIRGFIHFSSYQFEGNSIIIWFIFFSILP